MLTLDAQISLYQKVVSLSVVYIWLSRFLNKNPTLHKIHYHCWQHVGKVCRFTVWSAAHIVLYAFISFHCPDVRWKAVVVGILWEVAEYYMGHYDFFDIGWNTLGVLIGDILRG
jgi:hypothetical protein